MTVTPVLPADPSIVTVPSVTWPDERDAVPVALVCPNCGSPAPKPPVLTVSWITPDHPRRETHVLRCRDCTACFYDDQNPPDYTEPSLLERGRVPFYLQQGAGLSLITSPLARVRKPAGSAYLEVGCGFGFGLDFSVHARGWHGKGIDPAPLSGLGRQLLGLDIDLRYLNERDAASFACDVVMASETIEHVPSPAAFVRILAAALKPDGILILTTPDASRLVPATPPGSLVPLLSPGLHLVFQTARSLHALLERAGFGHVVVRQDACSLVAFASREPFALEEDEAAAGAIYRGYLERRARDLQADTDLFLAFAGRAFQEAVNAGDWPGARRVWELLQPVCADRFRLDPDAAIVPDQAGTLDLEGMARLMPLNLAELYYGRAMLALAEGAARVEVAPWFAAGATAAAALRRALNAIAIDDMMTEQLEWACRAELCLCAAASGAPDVVERLAALPPAPSGDSGEEQRRAIVLRTLVTLVNAGWHDRGEALAAATGLHDAPFAHPAATGPATEAERDALFSLAVLDARPVGDRARARARFARVRHLLPRAATGERPPLFWQALRGEVQASLQTEGGTKRLTGALVELGDDAERLPRDLLDLIAPLARGKFVPLVNAGRHEEAGRLASLLGMDPDAPDPPVTEAERSVLFCLGMLHLQPGGDPGRARRCFGAARSGLSAAIDAPLYWSALRGDLEAADRIGDRAATEDLLDEAEAIRDAADAPADLADRLLRRTRQRFVGLVNAGDYDAARALDDRVALDRDRPISSLDGIERDVMFCAGILDLQPGGDVGRARRALNAVRCSLADAEAPPALFWAALRGEIQAARRADPREAERLRETILAGIGQRLSGIPEDFLPAHPRSR